MDKTSLKEIKSLIDSFTISDEKFIENEYYAKLEVSFNKKNTLIFLEKKNIFPSIPLRNKVLLIPILVDTEINKVYLFAQNIFHKRWNDNIKNYHLLEYLLPSEDIEDIENVQKNLTNIEDYDFKSLIRKYDLEDYIISIMFKNKNNQLKVLSKINLNNSLKLDNQEFENINFQEQENLYEILNNLKIVYENYWKTNNAINTSIKLPITISIGLRKYKKIQKLEKAMSSIDLISSFNILKFDNQNIFYRIIYNGSPKTFLNDMKKNDLIVEMEKNIWIIK